ncbi:Aerobic respiration control sensor protein ArcB [Jannaschia seosinensis]|uniref:histidine kinase n=1 Tax=Jannaschia seosinensis TaxID=313367 RepID=A0A0M7B8I7_9RHOB|nr:response regulator [Jannaschia seosinensis]CUH29252.1 Aerobic respiration control sensor protein ArcB [Jannaschia seosinensis]
MNDGHRHLAHDIRSALSDVSGGLRLIGREDLPGRARMQLDRAMAASDLLIELIGELLQDTARAPERPDEALDLRVFLQDEARRWRGAAADAGIGVDLHCPSDLPRTARLDLLQLRRILANLMSNAVCHSGGSSVVLAAEVHGDGTLAFCVTDDGGGFPPELLAQTRDLFAGRGEGGADGLGLHIAAAHARAMGAALLVENLRETEGGQGARVTLTVPRSVWDGEAALREVPSLTGSRILVAEDSDTVRTLIEAILRGFGAECRMARDGIEALNWLARERFDLALIDVEMPTLGGLEVLRAERLRQARGVAPPTALVALTAHALRDCRDEITEAGAEGILTKPIGNANEFGKAVRHYLDAAPDSEAWRPEAAPALSAVTLSDLMATAGPETGADLLSGIRSDLADVTQRMQAAVAKAEPAAIRNEAHVLLSLAAAIGALPTQEAARRVNVMPPDAPDEAIVEAAQKCLERLETLRAFLDEAN